METSKSTLTVARLALRAARDALPDYARRKSPRKFTQPQLLACLIVKEFLRLDYRGMHVRLAEWSDLREVLGLQRVPHFTTLCAASRRLLRKPLADTMLASILALCRKGNLLTKRSKLAAIDSTGLESRHVSAYFTRRCGRHKGHYKHRFPKLSAICDTANHLILGAVIDRGPKLDYAEDEQTLLAAFRQQRFPTETYGQRWQIETVFSMFKRNLGSSLRARGCHSQTREIRLRIFTHDLMILLPPAMFYTEQDAPLFLLLVFRFALWPFLREQPFHEIRLGIAAIAAAFGAAVVAAGDELVGHAVSVPSPEGQLHVPPQLLHLSEELLVALDRADLVLVPVEGPYRDVLDLGRSDEVFRAFQAASC
jgi:hypothetical protein